MKKEGIKSNKLKYIFGCGVVGIILFAILLLSGKIQYGNMEEKYEDTDAFSSYSNRDLHMKQDDILEQELTKPQGTLESFSIKYHKDLFSDNLYLKIELCDSDKGKVIQKWTEHGTELGDDWFKEYVISNEKIDGTRNLKIKITANEENDVICCSEIDSLRGGSFTINGKEQEGDVIVRLTQNKNVVSTLVWAILCCLFFSGLCYIMTYYRVDKLIIKKIIIVLEKINIKKNFLKNSIVFLGILLVSIVIEKGISHYNLLLYNTVGEFNEYRCIFFAAVMLCVYIFINMRSYIAKKPEYVFILLLAVVGLLYVIIMPADAEISWDEAIHYWRAVGVSHAFDGKTNAADSWVYWHSGIGYMLPNSIDNLRYSQNNVQMLYETGKIVAANTDILGQIIAVAYIPSAIGLVIGRVLHLPYMMIYHLGAAMNMFIYIILVYFSVKRLKSGKMICITVACVLNSVFLASVYSSDSWITGFCMLGTSYFIGCMQEKKVVSKKDLFIMLGAYVLAFMPKAIYFPLFLLFLLLPKERFQNERQRVCFYISTIAFSITFCVEMAVSFKWFLLILFIVWFCIYGVYRLLKKLTKKQKIVIFVVSILACIIIEYFVIGHILPMLLGTGDARGGTEVNSANQVKFIISNPIKYTKILLKFLFGRYLVFEGELQVVFNTFGYLGQASFATISFVLLWIVAFTDKTKLDMWKGYNKTKVCLILFNLGIIVLIATALYVSFTPVGYETINGCQARYLLPLFPGFFAMIGSNKITNGISTKIYNTSVILTNIVILLLSAWQAVVRLYY